MEGGRARSRKRAGSSDFRSKGPDQPPLRPFRGWSHNSPPEGDLPTSSGVLLAENYKSQAAWWSRPPPHPVSLCWSGPARIGGLQGDRRCCGCLRREVVRPLLCSEWRGAKRLSAGLAVLLRTASSGIS